MLWFAFKMYLWFIDIQHSLLEEYREVVVICFQNVSLIYWYSTNHRILLTTPVLWFAFKMYLWFIDIQLQDTYLKLFDRCDLLSKCIFDLLIFNKNVVLCQSVLVVICFQNVSLIYWYSTRLHDLSMMFRLWFAFKMYLWFIDIQLPILTLSSRLGCDLLSKCIFDLLIFNGWKWRVWQLEVVICFQNVSLIYWYST